MVAVASNESSNPRPRRRRRLWPLFLGLIVILAVAWAGYWYVAFRMADGFVVNAANAEAGESVELACDEHHFGGFPLQITIECLGGGISSGDGANISLAQFAARAPLYNPGRVEADIVSPFNYSGVNHTIRSDWTGGRFGLFADFGGVAKASIAFGDLTFTVSDRVDETVWSAAANAWGTEIEPAAEEGALRLLLSAEDLVIIIGSETYPSFSGATSLILNGIGDQIDRAPDVLIGDWLRNGGTFQIERMDITSGDVVADVTGPMTLNVDGSLSGNLIVRYSGEEDLPILVAAIFPWLASEAEIIAEAIRLMSQPIEMNGGPAHEVRLIVREGEVRIGVIPLLTIPSVGPLGHYL